ncbi:MAG TPA: hypothetical protein VGK10_03090 [Prolixibacteraceae bacterium]|jgi:hypothetical protein
METLNAFDQLLDYPVENELIYETQLNEKRFFLSPNDPIQNAKYIVFRKQDLIFCAYDAYSTQLGSTETFTGIYREINLKPEMELEMSRKHWSDYMFTLNKRKTGIQQIDFNYTLTSPRNWNFQVLMSEQVADLFQELERQISPVKLIIQNNYIPMISQLKGKQVIGVETNEWIAKKEKVEQFLDLGGNLINHLMKVSQQFY